MESADYAKLLAIGEVMSIRLSCFGLLAAPSAAPATTADCIHAIQLASDWDSELAAVRDKEAKASKRRKAIR